MMRPFLSDCSATLGEGVDAGLALTYVLVSVFLVALAGLMSGLTLALNSLDSIDLELLKRSGTARERKHAERVEPVLRSPHLCLVTLLVVNSAAMEALPIFLDKLLDPVTAIILSVTAVLAFGEILPQALCSHYGLAIGAYTAWLVRGLMVLVGVIAWPIAKLLDWLLGTEHGALFRRAQLKALVDLHSQENDALGGYLSTDELAVIRGALDLTGKLATVGMTPLDKVFMLPLDSVLNLQTLKACLESGHSRVPVHRPGNRLGRDVLGLVLVKELVLIDLDAGCRVADLRIRPLPRCPGLLLHEQSFPFTTCPDHRLTVTDCPPLVLRRLRGDIACYDLLRLFKTGRSHMVLLTEPPSEVPPEGSSQEGPGPAADAAPLINGQPERQEDTASGQRPTLTEGQWDTAVAAGRAAQDGAGVAGEHDPARPPHDPDRPASQAAEGEPVGIVTIEDVLEELLGQEIVDETDRFVDNDRLQRVNAAALLGDLPVHLRTSLASQGRLPSLVPAGAPAGLEAPPTRPRLATGVYRQGVQPPVAKKGLARSASAMPASGVGPGGRSGSPPASRRGRGRVQEGDVRQPLLSAHSEGEQDSNLPPTSSGGA